jgi:uncharacterized protein YbjT (DUF2867 family)
MKDGAMITRKGCSMLRVIALGLAFIASSFAAQAVKAENGAVLVFGGTGQLGAEVVKALLSAGHDVTVFARPGSKSERLAGLKVATVTGDVLKEDDVAAAFKSAKFDAAVDALARGDAGVDFYETSQRLISKWAKATGVKQVVLHGSVGAGKSRAIYPDAMWPRMKDTLQAKERGENHLIASGVAYTIIRNARLPPSSTPATGKAKLFEDETKFGAVTRADLGTLTAQCTLNPTCFNKIYHAADDSLPVGR